MPSLRWACPARSLGRLSLGTPRSLSEASVPTHRPARQRKGLLEGRAAGPSCPLRRPRPAPRLRLCHACQGPAGAPCSSPSLCETRLECQRLRAASLPSAVGTGHASRHRSRGRQMRAARGLQFPCGCLCLTSGATSGSRILPGDRASGERVRGAGEGARWPSGTSGAGGHGGAGEHRPCPPVHTAAPGGGAERPLLGLWRGGLARTPGLTHATSSESRARTGSLGSAPAPRQTSLCLREEREAQPARPACGPPALPVPSCDGSEDPPFPEQTVRRQDGGQGAGVSHGQGQRRPREGVFGT